MIEQFRVLSFGIGADNFILGHISRKNFVLVPEKEREKSSYPYTTVIIGNNGAGKSTLLSYLSDIFQDLKYYQDNFKRKSRLQFSYEIEFQSNGVNYHISQRRENLKKDKNDNFIFGFKYQLSVNGVDLEGTKEEWQEVKLPKKVIAVSYLPLDRFKKKRNDPEDYYLYLGMIDANGVARPASLISKCVNQLFDTVEKNKSVNFIKEILNFMEVDNSYLGIKTSYRYKEYFFSEEMSIARFEDLMTNWEKFSKRKDEPYGVRYYKANIQDNPDLIGRIVTYINTRIKQDKISFGVESILDFNLFDNPELLQEWRLLEHLRKMDLVENYSIDFKKKNGNYVEDVSLSSGEFHYFTTIISICASIEKNSLVLIDEPETSFHPEWQMKYVNHLKELLQSFNSCHFIFGSHSHFIVSDLENRSSEVVSLKGMAPKIEVDSLDYPTYGWSAEEILFKVFKLRSTRNQYFEIRVHELLHLISNKSTDTERIELLMSDLGDVVSDKNDPLNKIINEAKSYIKNF